MPSPVGFSESIHYGDDTTYYVDWLTNEDSFPTLGQNTSKVTSMQDWEKIDYLKEQQIQQYVDVAVKAQDTLADVNEYYPFPSIHSEQQKHNLYKQYKKSLNNTGDSDGSDDDFIYDGIDMDIYQHYKSTSPDTHRKTSNHMKQMKELIVHHLDSLDALTLREIHKLINNQAFSPYKTHEQRMRPNINKKDPLKNSFEEDFSIKSYKHKHQKKSKFNRVDYDDYDY